MTREEVRAMTPEEKQRRMAELMGLPEVGYMSGELTYAPMPHRRMPVPNYCNDLNAVAGAERVLLVEYRDGKKWRDHTNAYEDYLMTICCARENPDVPREFCTSTHATADQRTTALILTLSTQR